MDLSLNIILLIGFFQAAAALCVGMGSFSDPLEAQGLAHFLGLCLEPCLCPRIHHACRKTYNSVHHYIMFIYQVVHMHTYIVNVNTSFPVHWPGPERGYRGREDKMGRRQGTNEN